MGRLLAPGISAQTWGDAGLLQVNRHLASCPSRTRAAARTRVRVTRAGTARTPRRARSGATRGDPARSARRSALDPTGLDGRWGGRKAVQIDLEPHRNPEIFPRRRRDLGRAGAEVGPARGADAPVAHPG